MCVLHYGNVKHLIILLAENLNISCHQISLVYNNLRRADQGIFLPESLPEVYSERFFFSINDLNWKKKEGYVFS